MPVFQSGILSLWTVKGRCVNLIRALSDGPERIDRFYTSDYRAEICSGFPVYLLLISRVVSFHLTPLSFTPAVSTLTTFTTSLLIKLFCFVFLRGWFGVRERAIFVCFFLFFWCVFYDAVTPLIGDRTYFDAILN